MRVAIATRDGITINDFFGKARYFHIYELNQDNSFQLVEMREYMPFSSSVDYLSKKEDRYEENRYNAITENLKDCVAVCLSRIGNIPRSRMKMAGINMIIVQGSIKDFLESNF